MDLGSSEELGDLFGLDFGLLQLFSRDFARHLAGKTTNFTLELANTGFACVAGDDCANCVIGDHDLLVTQTGLFDLPRSQITLGDFQLFGLGIAGEIHHLHAVLERSRDVLEVVGGANELHLREIEGDAQIVIGEAIVLGRVEDLEQRRSGVALIGRSQFVDFVEQEDRVFGAGLLHALNDAARHGPDIGATVAADVCLVTHAAERDSYVLAVHGAGDGFGDRGLANPRRAGKKQDRIATGGVVDRGLGIIVVGVSGFGGLLGLLLQHPYCQELEDPILDVTEGVVVFLEDFGSARNVHSFFGTLGPRQLTDGFEVGTNDLRLHTFGTHAFEPIELALNLLACRFRELQGLELFSQLFEVLTTAVIAELALDGLELLAQEHLALAVAELFLDLAFDVLLGVEDRDLLLSVEEHRAQAIFY